MDLTIAEIEKRSYRHGDVLKGTLTVPLIGEDGNATRHFHNTPLRIKIIRLSAFRNTRNWVTNTA